MNIIWVSHAGLLLQVYIYIIKSRLSRKYSYGICSKESCAPLPRKIVISFGLNCTIFFFGDNCEMNCYCGILLLFFFLRALTQKFVFENCYSESLTSNSTTPPRRILTEHNQRPPWHKVYQLYFNSSKSISYKAIFIKLLWRASWCWTFHWFG